MHERHLVEALVNEVVRKAKATGAKKVTQVTLIIGELSGLAEESVRLYFEELTQGTLAAGAALIVNPVQAKLRCNTCDMVFDRKIGSFDCPHCGNLGISTGTGKEFYIDSIEIES